MRVGISCYPTYGGSGVVACELALALARLGHEVHVISYALPPRLADENGELERHGVVFHRVEVKHYPLFEYPPYSLALATKMVEVVRRFDLDLLHAHYAVPNALSAVLARQIAAPQPVALVTTLHGTDVTLVGNDPSYLETTRFSLQQSDRVTAVSDWLRRRTLEQLRLDREIEVVPNFVVAERFPEPRPAAGPPTLLHVSNYRRLKRVVDVVEIFARVRQRLDCRLLMVGEGPERAAAEERCRRLGLADVGAVEFRDNQRRIEPVYGEGALLLLPSEQESFGLVALEALAAGVPVIASDAGGLPEVVRHGVDGLLYPVGDVEGMAQGALELLGDPERARAFGAAGKARARAEFSLEAALQGYVAVYERALDSQRVPA